MATSKLVLGLSFGLAAAVLAPPLADASPPSAMSQRHRTFERGRSALRGRGLQGHLSARSYTAPQRSYRHYRSGRSHHFGTSRYYYRPYYYRHYYRPYYYYPYYYPYYYGTSFSLYYGYRPFYSGYYDHHYPGAVGYAYGHGAVRTQVEPKTAEVYVDGYYAGIVDDFDGYFQKLYLSPGEHEIVLRLEGHRDYRRQLHVSPTHTYKIHHTMERLAPGETNPSLEPERPAYPDRRSPPEDDVNRLPPPAPESRPEYRTPPRPGPETRFGIVAIRAQPEDVEVVIDGSPWGTLEGFEELQIHLPEGRHQIEIRREGYESFTTELEIVRGQTTPLNVRLAPRRSL